MRGGGGGCGCFLFLFLCVGGGGGGLRGTRASEFFYKESKSKNLFLLRIQIENKKYRVFGGVGGERWGKGEWEASFSEFFFTKNPHLKYFFLFFWRRGRGGGGGGARVSDFFLQRIQI